MSSAAQQYDQILASRENATIEVYTLGSFRLLKDRESIPEKQWGRDKAVQLFQYMITNTAKRSQHKETIIDRLWEEDGTDQDFKVAMHGISKTLEPDRAKRSPSKYILRNGISYQLEMEHIWVDSHQMESLIILANQLPESDKEWAILALQSAVSLCKGQYLPNRIYEDWTTAERERLQIIGLGAFMTLGELLLEENPAESIRLAQEVLMLDNTWEDAYRLQMKGYMMMGNRPQAIKTYTRCKEVLAKEYAISPLPETEKVYQQIISL